MEKVGEIVGALFVITLIVFLVLGIVSIGKNSNIYPSDLATAEELCGPNGGWAKLETNIATWRTLNCANGAEFSFKLEE